MKIKLTITFLLISFLSFAQSDAEEVLKLMNEARTDPSAFLTSRLLPYVEENEMKENSYAQSLINELKQRKPVAPLSMDSKLTSTARSHASDMGKKGMTGHTSSNGTNFAERVRKKIKNGMIGENCDYGNDTPLDIVMALLIDDGIKSLGHRKNILNAGFHFVGIAIEPHKTYGTNCVMDFAEVL